MCGHFQPKFFIKAKVWRKRKKGEKNKKKLVIGLIARSPVGMYFSHNMQKKKNNYNYNHKMPDLHPKSMTR